MPNVLFIGDIVGKPGRSCVIKNIAGLRASLNLDFVVANAENAAGGAGLTGRIARDLLSAGVDALTLGDHVWDQRGFDQEIDELECVCRPANLPEECPGRKWLVVERSGFRLGIVTVLGRQYLRMIGTAPFQVVESVIETLRSETDGMLVEVHAEATSEKIAMGWYLDGRAGGVLGTHTHVPTADAAVLPRGTGYITDVGMTGPYHSVLGREIAPVIARFVDGMPRRFPVAEYDIRLCGALLKLDRETGLCVSIEQVNLLEADLS